MARYFFPFGSNTKTTTGTGWNGLVLVRRRRRVGREEASVGLF